MPDKVENKRLYLLQAVACLFVIGIHAPLPTFLGDIVSALGRFAVPFFFMVSGYFTFTLDKKNIKQVIRRRIKKNVALLSVSFLIYWTINIIFISIEGQIVPYVDSILTIENIFKLIFLNYTTTFIGVGHLWFLLALVYVYIVIYMFYPKITKLSYIFIILLMLIPPLEYFSLKHNLDIDPIFYRNFIFQGLPLFFIGGLIGKNSNKIKGITDDVFVFSLFITILVFFVEYSILTPESNLYYNSVMFSVLALAYCVKYPKLERCKVLVTLGKDFSSQMYLFHYIAIIFLNKFNNVIPYFDVIRKASFIWVTFSTYVFILLFHWCYKRTRSQL
ncbi:acyltransferase family protein [Streptococcus suis]